MWRIDTKPEGGCDPTGHATMEALRGATRIAANNGLAARPDS